MSRFSELAQERQRRTSKVSPVEPLADAQDTLEVTRGRGRPATGKRSNPDYKPFTFFMQKGTHKKLKLALLQNEDARDVSELIQDLCEQWLSTNAKI